MAISNVGSLEKMQDAQALESLDSHISPGVGEYNAEDISIIKKKPPNATIGNSVRFRPIPPSEQYKLQLPQNYL